MTATPKGTRSPQIQAQNASVSSGCHTPTSQRSTEALERRLNILEVEDASRLVECSQVERQLRFQHLVRRYLSQIQYGCMSAYCATPTCLTCNKRLVSRPFRPPTQLTARALAFYLASQENPHRGLCPHQLKVDPTSLEIEGADGVSIRQGRGDVGKICYVFPRAELCGRRSNVRENATSRNAGDGTEEQNDPARIMDAIAARHQTKKDPKSLGQNLYDTVTMIYCFSKQIPSPLSVFAALRSPSSEPQQCFGNSVLNKTISTPDLKRSGPLANDFTEQPNGRDTSHLVNENHILTETNLHNSHRSTKRPSRTNTNQIVSEILSNGQSVHKIRHLPELAGHGHLPHKPSDPSPLDGTLENSSSEKRKMRTKPAAIDLTVKPKERTPPNREKSNGIPKLEHDTPPKLPVVSHLTCDIMDQLKEGVYHHRDQRSADFNYVVDFDTNRRFRPAKPFVNRSMFFTLSHPESLLKSFRDQPNGGYANSPLPHLDSYRLTNAFRDWNRRNGALIFDSLYIAVEALFTPPPNVDTRRSPRLKPSRKDANPQQSPERSSLPEAPQATSGRYLSDEEAAHIVMICIHALTSLVPNGWPHTWVQLRKFRGWGVVIPVAEKQTDFTDGFAHPWLSIVDELEYEPAIRLADRLLRGIGARMCFEHILASLQSRGSEVQPPKTGSFMAVLVKHLAEVERDALARKTKMRITQTTNEDPGWTVSSTFMEWLRTIIVKQWDGKAEISKWTSVGTAVILLDSLHTNMGILNLRPQMFHIPYLNERIDTVQEPIEFLSWEKHPNSFHILQYSFLFPQEYLVGYFRTINFTTMFGQFERSGRATYLGNRMDFLLSDQHRQTIRSRLKVTLSDYLVLDIGRENALKDTLDQLWCQEKRMLLKPLKVMLGAQEGEVGFDQGGVTCEFFRLVLTEAFKPDNGMFTIDPMSRMIWFQPASFEPDWKFQMLGVLFSLAVYNGITLPVTFPLALYQHLLELDHAKFESSMLTTDYIRDGWPQLAKSFDELLTYDGEVADVYMRDYIFSFEAFGRNIDVNMQTFHNQPWTLNDDLSSEATSNKLNTSKQLRIRLLEDTNAADAAPVTNANREKFVKDYISSLTFRSIEPQLTAFAKGFHTCLHPKSLHLFTPATLRALVEGSPMISIPLLRKSTRYEDGYSATHSTILDFWAIVEEYDQEHCKKLLEFVTASERVPITGFESMSFVVVRAGEDTELLPTSSTCFGKLMLPEYKGREKMREKLELALGNCEGFGVV